jgi:hypothetical protein
MHASVWNPPDVGPKAGESPKGKQVKSTLPGCPANQLADEGFPTEEDISSQSQAKSDGLGGVDTF